jgi:hypothetical protein
VTSSADGHLAGTPESLPCAGDGGLTEDDCGVAGGGADTEGGADGVTDTKGGADGEPVTVTEPAGVATVDGELNAESGLDGSTCVSVATGLIAGDGTDACELLLHAVALAATITTQAVAAKAFNRMAAPQGRHGTERPHVETNHSPVTDR